MADESRLDGMTPRPDPNQQNHTAMGQEGRGGRASARLDVPSLAVGIFLGLAMLVGILIARDFGVSTGSNPTMSTLGWMPEGLTREQRPTTPAKL